MFLNSVHKQQEIRKVALENLADLGIKFKPKKLKKHSPDPHVKKVFNVPLGALPSLTVTLASGQQLVVPKILHELCNYLLPKINTEGIFRKEGSKARQTELKALLDSGGQLGFGHEILDVSSVLKLFLRELPEPVIPFSFHDAYIQCILLPKDTRLEAVLLCSLLLPMEHLCTLSYLCQFLETVSLKSNVNRMSVSNLSVCLSPNIFRQNNNKAITNKHRLDLYNEIFSMLIRESQYIGMIPSHVLEAIEDDRDKDEEEHKKKKRRSGSVTRVFNGLRKIVGTKSNEETPPHENATPDLLLTPSISRTGKKRKVDINGLSNKKKKELMDTLPDAGLLNVPYTPTRTPISVHPNPRNGTKLQMTEENIQATQKNGCVKEKKFQWYSRGRTVKSTKQNDETTSRKSLGPKSMLERRWSAVSQAANFRKNKNKRNSSSSLLQNKEIKTTKEEETKPTEPDYVRIPKVEYEEIKNKVSEIERRISIELDKVQSQMIKNNDTQKMDDNNIVSVQTAYEKTLVHSKPLSPTTDQLARRLSKELKIRRSSEQKIIRSPSARKIGSLRRRSRDSEKRNVRLSRHQSWHVSTAQFIPRVNLKRGKPNTINVGLPTPVKDVTNSPFLCSTPLNLRSNVQNNKTNSNSQIISKIQSSPLHKSYSFSTSRASYDNSGCSTKWTSGDRFFNHLRTPNDSTNSENCRPSLAKLRSQNAGMVLAKAKLFDNLVDSDNSVSSYKLETSNSSLSMKLPTVKTGGNVRNSCRVRTLKIDNNKKNISPRRRNATINQRQKLHIAKQLSDNSKRKCNSNTPLKDNNNRPDLIPSTPKTPSIKKSLNVRSPKRLNRTPNTVDRKTPLKVFTKGTHF